MDLHRYQFSAVADLVMGKRDFEHKKSQSEDWLKVFGSGGWNRTNGLQVMSLTSYLCSTPQCVLQTIIYMIE